VIERRRHGATMHAFPVESKGPGGVPLQTPEGALELLHA
jgi:hypothetical protein